MASSNALRPGLSVCSVCSMKPKSSFSIREEWLTKSKKEAFFNRLENVALCINFNPNGENYYVINEKLMQVLCEKLKEY